LQKQKIRPLNYLRKRREEEKEGRRDLKNI
jgi:hypothetical protein